MAKSVTPDAGDGSAGEASIRRHVTVLFSDLCASTFLGDQSDPEILAEILHRVKAAARGVVPRHGGVVNQFYGDGVMAVFGFPTPCEDDVRRATEAALELHDVVRALPLAPYLPASFSVRLHSGVHAGLVVVGRGDPAHGRYELIGDAPNTAAGLCTSAQTDEIVVSASTLRGALPFFDVQALEPITLKGKPRPIPAYRVLRRSGIRTRFEARASLGLTPFVGRTEELGRLEALLDEVRDGQPRVVSLVGDAGIGKTRAAQEFVQRAASGGCRVLRGYCESYGSVGPYQPLLLMLRALFALGRDGAPEHGADAVTARLVALDEGLLRHRSELLRLLSLPGGGEPEGRPGEEDTIAALSALFLALARRRPLVLFIDDWQWVDDASRQVLRATIRAARDAPILLITASRELGPSDTVAGDAEILALAPFREVESAQAVGALLRDRLDLGLASELHRRSGGNALFLEELCQSVADQAGDARTANGVSAVPNTLHGLIEARVDRLPRAQVEIVRTAAVIGDVIPAWLLERLSGHRENEEIVRELDRRGLILAGEIRGTLRFKHGITREVVYESVRLQQRRALHLRVAAALEERAAQGSCEDLYEALAYHYARGADHERAAYYAERAGDKSMATSALDRARQQYGAAIDALEQLDPSETVRRRLISISMRWAWACIYSPAREQLAVLGRAAEHARQVDDADGLAHAEYWQGFLNYALGEQRDCVAHTLRALEVARKAGNERMISQLIATLGQSLAAACDYPRAMARLDEAIELKRRRSSRSSSASTPVGAAYAMACKAFILGDLGHFEAAGHYIREALDAIRGAGDPVEGSIRAQHGAILCWQGRFEEALDAAARAQVTAARVSGSYAFATGRTVAGYARFCIDHSPAALEALCQSADWLEERGIRLHLSLFYGWLADAMEQTQSDALARVYGLRALGLARKGDRLGEGMACRALARLSARSRDPALSLPSRYLELALDSAQQRGSEREVALTRLQDAELEASRGRPAEAAALVAQARDAFRGMGMPRFEARAVALAERL